MCVCRAFEWLLAVYVAVGILAVSHFVVIVVYSVGTGFWSVFWRPLPFGTEVKAIAIGIGAVWQAIIIIVQTVGTGLRRVLIFGLFKHTSITLADRSR
jgi:hypothetical protein